MLNENEITENKEIIQALKKWMNSDKTAPYIFPKRNNCEVIAILFPKLLSRVKFHLSYFIMWIVSKIPWSPVKIFVFRLMGVNIGKGVYIAPWVFLDGMYPHLIELEDGCLLGGGCRILTHESTVSEFRVGRVRVGTNSVIGAFSVVRCGISVGSNVTTGIGSVILKDIPDNRVAIGNPARIVKNVKNNNIEFEREKL
jgi:acetyltransferase-like isoleucine patch superfamily enzyme